MAQITKDTLIGEILNLDASTAPFFLEMGMHCLGCPASRGESLAEACMVHGVDPDVLVEKLNAHLADKYFFTPNGLPPGACAVPGGLSVFRKE